MRPWSVSALLSRLRTSLLSPWRDAARSRGRTARLAVSALEDRLVPTAVAPGGAWDDGVVDAYGYKTGITVTLSNSGGGWLEVTGGNGAVSVSPGSAPSYSSGSGSGSGSWSSTSRRRRARVRAAPGTRRGPRRRRGR